VVLPDESRLLDAARRGSPEAIEALLERYEPRVYRFSLKMCRHPEDARDVLQETLLALARSVTDFRGAASLSTWLYTIARSYCIKKRRRSKFAPEALVSLESESREAAQALPDPARGPDALLENERLRRALEQAIARLGPGDREVLALRDIEGLSAAETAQVTGLSVEAVKSRLHRARARVRRQLDPVLGPGGPGRARARGCPDIVALFSRYLEGEIGPGTCAEMERHLEGCPRCRDTCDSLKRTLRLCRSAPTPNVPAPLQESIRRTLREFLSAGA
jgi:RNA polymerase sigma-70 factor (ECF subfamily)